MKARLYSTYAGRWLKMLRQLVYVPHCAACGVALEDGWLCVTCSLMLNTPLENRCRQCGVMCTAPRCFNCASADLILDGVCVGLYEEPLATLVQNFKYRGDRALLAVLAPCLVTASMQLSLPDAVTFVPLTRRRQRQRGFNQAALLAQAVAKARELPVVDLLKKVRHTVPQAGLPQAERRLNLSDAFCASTTNLQSLWLVDDVRTTGTTLEACASALKKAGARRVQVLVLAVAPR